MINIKVLLAISLLMMSIIYYMFLTNLQIIEIVESEYILISINLILLISLIYFKNKLKNLTLLEFIQNTNSVTLKSTIFFFLIFQVVDFYYENGFIGMISQWFIYWLFGILAVLVTSNINYYKNYKFYKYESIDINKF